MLHQAYLYHNNVAEMTASISTSEKWKRRALTQTIKTQSVEFPEQQIKRGWEINRSAENYMPVIT